LCVWDAYSLRVPVPVYVIRRRPWRTLFPYTTLFRSDGGAADQPGGDGRGPALRDPRGRPHGRRRRGGQDRQVTIGQPGAQAPGASQSSSPNALIGDPAT